MYGRLERRGGVGAVVILAAAFAGCSGGGSQSAAMMPAANGANGPAGNAVVRIFVPAGPPNGLSRSPGAVSPPQAPQMPGGPIQLPTVPSPGTGAPPPPGSQVLAINVSGPTSISQTVTVGPNAGGCTPAAGGTSCQLSLALPAGTYTGTIGATNGTLTAIAFTVTPNGQNVFALATGGTPSQLAIVPGSALSLQNAQGGIDLYGAGRHLLLVEALDSNQNVIVGSAPGTFTLNQSGGVLPLTIVQPSASAANLFYVTAGGAAGPSTAYLRATANYLGPFNPCVQPSAVCTGSVRVDQRQLLGVANSAANDVTLYTGGQNGQNQPLTTVSSGVTDPQALVFDGLGNLFVADQPGSVTVYAPPYVTSPTTVATGVSHPQALAVDSRGNLFVANGSGSNTITVYPSPYTGPPGVTIGAGISDPVCIALDAAGDLYVVNQANNTVTIYAPPYTSSPVTLAKGLNAPNSLALDAHGNLFVANLNSTPNSVVEFSPPFSKESAPIVTITNGVNEQGTIGLSGSANLFVPNQGADNVTEYVAPYLSAPTTIAGGQSQPIALAIDAFGNLYVANLGNNTITQYPPPYGGGSWTTISNGINGPLAIQLSPATNGGAALLP